jgi:predicted ribosomally synthesized peptide with nif11-like leader
MSVENVVSFWEKVQQDKDLQSRVNPKAGTVPKMGANVQPDALKDLARIAKEAGYDATPQEFAAAESVMRFWDQVSKDKNLQNSLKGAQAGSEGEAAAAVVKVAQGAGYKFTGKELTTVTNALQGTGWMKGSSELSDDELQSVAGGLTATQFPTLFSYKLALTGGLQTSFRRIGPGSVAEYM